jgi:anti-sigma B factor antagonist
MYYHHTGLPLFSRNSPGIRKAGQPLAFLDLRTYNLHPLCMKLLIEIRPGYYLIELDGDLDASSSILVDKAIQEAIQLQKENLLVNCQKLRYISSAGIGVFIAHLNGLEKTGTHLVLHSLSPTILDVFQLLELDKVFTIVPTMQEAFSLLSPFVPLQSN